MKIIRQAEIKKERWGRFVDDVSITSIPAEIEMDGVRIRFATTYEPERAAFHNELAKRIVAMEETVKLVHELGNIVSNAPLVWQVLHDSLPTILKGISEADRKAREALGYL